MWSRGGRLSMHVCVCVCVCVCVNALEHTNTTHALYVHNTYALRIDQEIPSPPAALTNRRFLRGLDIRGMILP